MKVGIIAKTNQKGQVVIPKKIRDSLGITADVSLHILIRDKGVYMYPITNIVTPHSYTESYFAILTKTKGAWSDERTQSRKNTEHRKREWAESRMRKQPW